MVAVLVAVLLAGAPHGATDPHVTQRTIHSTICTRGYATSVRPPLSYTAPIKRRLLAGRPAIDYQLDHIIPLELGGAPRDLANLWLEPIWEAHIKDHQENALHDAVCAGAVTLRAARAQMRAFTQVGLPPEAF